MDPLIWSGSSQESQSHLQQPAEYNPSSTSSVFEDVACLEDNLGHLGVSVSANHAPKETRHTSQQYVKSSTGYQVLPKYTDSIHQHLVWWSWHPVWDMYASLLLGIGFDIGHHWYYASLHGQPATDQVQRLRYGTFLAFLTKASLIWSVFAALRQRIWFTLRNKSLSLKGVDSLFALADDPLAALDWKTIMNTKVTLLMASITW